MRPGRLAVISVVLLVGACTSSGRPTLAGGSRTSPTTTAAAPAGCNFQVTDEALPGWARAGFNGDARVPHVFGERNEILAVLFGYPLAEPRPAGSANKILWVPRQPITPLDPLRISARLDGTGEPVGRQVDGGPGPSIIDFPAPGCWHLTLAWSGHTDSLVLWYAPGRSGS